MVGIIILNYNTYESTVECIASIEKYVKCQYRIYLVDNNSKEECKRKIEEKYTDYKTIQLIMLPTNLGYSGGNNVGVKQAVLDGADAILIMNSDVVLMNDIVTILKSDLNEKTVLAGPKIYSNAGENGQYLRKNYNFLFALTDKKPFYYIRKIVKFTDVCYQVQDWDKKRCFNGMLSGCCFLIDASSFSKMGFFDDNVFLYAEEYIIGKKLEAMELKTCYDPKAKIIHKHGSSTGSISDGFVSYHTYVSTYYVLKRYCKARKGQLAIIRAITFCNYFLRSLKFESYRERIKKLTNKLKEIDEGRYKIHF